MGFLETGTVRRPEEIITCVFVLCVYVEIARARKREQSFLNGLHIALPFRTSRNYSFDYASFFFAENQRSTVQILTFNYFVFGLIRTNRRIFLPFNNSVYITYTGWPIQVPYQLLVLWILFLLDKKYLYRYNSKSHLNGPASMCTYLDTPERSWKKGQR